MASETERESSEPPQPDLSSLVALLKGRALDSLHVGINLEDAQGRIIYANLASHALYDYPSGELIGKQFSELHVCTKQEAGDLLREMVASIDTRGEWQGELVNRRRDGTTFFTESRVVRLLGPGEPFYICMQTDVTAERKDREKIKEIESLLQRMASTVSELFWIYSVDRRQLLYLSAAYEQIWGRSREELFQHPELFYDSIYPDDRALLLSVFEEQQHGLFRDEYRQEFRIVRPDGSLRWVMTRYSPVRNEAGQVIHVAGISADITERKQVEVELREVRDELESRIALRTQELMQANERLNAELAQHVHTQRALSESVATNRLLLEAIPDLIFKVSSDGRFVECFPTGSIEMVAQPDELIGRRIEEVLPAYISSQANAGVEQTIRTGEASSFEYELTLGPTAKFFEARISRCEPDSVLIMVRDVTERKQTEAELRRHSDILNQTHDAIISTDLEGRIVTWNHAAEVMTGYTATEAIGQPVAMLAPPEEMDEIRSRVAPLLGKGGAHVIEIRCLRKNGEAFWIDLRLSALCDPAGRSIGCIGAALDISDRKRADEQTQRLQQMMLQAERLARIGSWEWDFETGLIEASPELFRQLRIHQDGLAQPTFDVVWNYIHPDDLESVQKAAALSFETGKAPPLQFRFRLDDGEIRYVRSDSTVIMNAAGAPRCIRGIVHDITEQRQAENELRAGEQRLRQILDSMHIFAGLFSTDGRVLDVNRALLSNASMERSNVIGQVFWDTAWWAESPEARRQLQSIFARVAQGEAVRCELESRSPNAATVTIDAQFSPLLDPEGHVTQIVGSGIDISERISQQAALRLQQEEMARVLRAASLGELATGIAHELNQPLTAMAASAHTLSMMIRGTETESPRTQAILKQIIDQALRAGEIIRRLREFVGKTPSQRTKADISQVVAGVLPMILHEARLQDVQVVAELESALPTVLIDVVQIQQVVLNMLQNALDSVTLFDNTARRIRLTAATTSNGWIRVSVDDNGPGITAANRDRIFEAFYTTKPTGMGMGLAISRSIVQSHGGTMWLDHRQSGALFHFTIPYQ